LISVKKEEVHRVGFHQAARGPHRHPAGRGRADHRKRSGHPRHREGEAPGGRGRGRGPRPHRRQRQPRSARRRRGRPRALQQVRRHRGEVRRRRVPRALGSRRAGGRRPLTRFDKLSDHRVAWKGPDAEHPGPSSFPLRSPTDPPRIPRSHPRSLGMLPDAVSDAWFHTRIKRHTALSRTGESIMALEDNVNVLGTQWNLGLANVGNTDNSANLEDNTVIADNEVGNTDVEDNVLINDSGNDNSVDGHSDDSDHSVDVDNDDSVNEDESINDSVQVNDSFNDDSVHDSGNQTLYDHSVNTGIRQYDSGINELNIGLSGGDMAGM